MNGHTLDLLVIGGYLLFLVGTGLLLRSSNKNAADYFRTGSRSTWWLLGVSMFVSGFSVRTFTANAGVAFEAGWTFLMIFLPVVLMGVIHFAFLANWFRNLRVTTYPDVVRMRFGPGLEQFYSAFSQILFLLSGGIIVWAMAIFASSVFGFDVKLTILGVGIVSVIYSVTGGRWAVFITDFLQAIIIIPTTLLLAWLCLDALGGWDGMLTKIAAAGLQETFAPVKPPDAFAGGQYSAIWLTAFVFLGVFNTMEMAAAQRYFSAKDGRHARWGAFLSTILVILGVMIWVIPPITARLLFPEAVMDQKLNKPEEAAFAVASLQLLPHGLLGLVVVSMFAATMSSLDTAINNNSAMFILNTYPGICRRLGIEPSIDPKRLLQHSRWFSLAYGILVVASALYFSQMQGVGMFEIMLKVGAYVGIPLTIPKVLGLFITQTPKWSGMATILGTSAVVIAYNLSDADWTYNRQVFTFLAVGITIFLASKLFWNRTSEAEKQELRDFHRLMRTPVDFEREIGAGSDASQLRIVGWLTTLMALALLLLLIPLRPEDYGKLLFVSGFILVVGLSMLALAYQRAKRSKAQNRIEHGV